MSDEDPALPEDPEELTPERARKPVIPIPPRWQQLRVKISAATSLHRHKPTVPLHKIGRFDAVLYRGHGVYGIVFEAIDPQLQRRVALKLCQVHDDQTVDDVLAEARALAKLNHPNVVTIFETGEHDGDVFFVMEYATGGTVERLVDSEDPPWQEVLDIYLGAGAGLAAAHEHEPPIIHGDFKPTNVLIDEGGVRPRVADFGFARIRHEHMPEHEREATQAQRGTLAYCAPEVLRGQPADALSDQWSFCASFWESLEGILPFNAKTTNGMLATIDRLKPHWINERVPKSLREVLERGLSIERDERYPSMAELLRALEPVRQAAPPPSEEDRLKVVVQPAERRPRKVRGWGYSAAIGMLVGGLSVFVAMRFADERARDSGTAVEPTTPTGECAVEPGESIRADPELHEALLGVCHQIRVGQFDQANAVWAKHFRSGDSTIAEATFIVARTFNDTAERDPDRASEAAAFAEDWTRALVDEHAGVKDTEDR